VNLCLTGNKKDGFGWLRRYAQHIISINSERSRCSFTLRDVEGERENKVMWTKRERELT